MAIADFLVWDGTIDFCKAKNELELAVLRVQCGSTIIDKNYQSYVAGCKQYNIPFGTYAYAKFVSVSDARQEAKDCFSRMDKSSLFVVVDVEEQTCKNPSDLVSATQAYIDYLHSQGVKKVGLYSGESFYKEHGLSSVKADFVWLALYGINDGKPHTKPSTPCHIWQYTDKGRISGVSCEVDLNMIVGDKPLSYFTGKEQIKVPYNASNIKGAVTVLATDLKLRKAPNVNAEIIRNLLPGEEYNLYGIVNGWFNLGGGWAWAQDGQYIRIDRLEYIPAPPVEAPKPTPKPEPKPVEPPTPAPPVEQPKSPSAT